MPTKVLNHRIAISGIGNAAVALLPAVDFMVKTCRDDLEIIYDCEDFAPLREGRSAALAVNILRNQAPETSVAVSINAALAIQFPTEEMSLYFFDAIRRHFPHGDYSSSTVRFSFIWNAWKLEIDLVATSPLEYRVEAELNRKETPSGETADSIEALGRVFQEWLEGLRQHGFTP